MEIVVAITAIVAAIAAIIQIRVGQKAVRVQRTIDLHRDLTTGEVRAARDRFTALMWRHGEARAGRNVCHVPSWTELLTDVLGGGERGELGEYRPEDKIAGAEGAEPMRDLYAVLWCFERIEAGRAGRALDRRLLAELIASHAVWWDELTRRLTSENTTHVKSLRSLAESLATPELLLWARRDFEAAS
jgi:hypothetical protein